MDGFLTLTNRALAFYDAEATSQPQQKAFDWTFTGVKAVSVKDPKSHGGSIPIGGSATVFDGTRATTLDGTSAFSVALSVLDAGTRYRFTWTGGTNPTLRTDRGLTLNAQSVTVAVLANSTVSLTLGGGTFAGTIVGDVVFIPGLSTGDSATVFNESNTGFWTVIAVPSSTVVQLVRPAGTSFSATGEVVTLASDAQLQAFSADGVQVGDSVKISAGFSSISRRTYTVDVVTSTWFEVLSTAALASETGVLPGASGLIFYTDGKRFVHFEVDQDAVLQLDGDTGETNTVSPVQAGDPRQMGPFEKLGAVHKLVILNKSLAVLNFVGLSAR
jgi:hypothetical protein